jgi:cytochrome c oxidase cbb3-type subunit I/II
MLNGLLTLRGAWDRVRQDPVLKFLAVAVTAYGMSTFEGPMLSVKSVNAISHYTDWIIAHVHVGALGWNGLLTFGILYWLIPRIYNTKIYSVQLANTHFWIATLGIIFYAIPLYWAGWTQSLMWKEFTAEGLLKYPNFLETVTQLIPMYAVRAFGGLLFFSGLFLMLYNLLKTVASGRLVSNEAAEAPARERLVEHKGDHWHKWIEARPIQMLLVSFVLVAIGGLIEFLPLVFIDSNSPKIASVKPYTPLELEGRDIYVREGCVGCHSQMIRPFRSEVERYDPTGGRYSMSGEFIYDRPFLWGSKRTGPDLHRVGGKYPDSWHYNHMIEPTALSPGSIMPAYQWLAEKDLNTTHTSAKITALRKLGSPYEPGYEQIALDDLKAQAKIIGDKLKKDGVEQEGLENKEIVALIAYLQRLGTDIKAEKQASK